MQEERTRKVRSDKKVAVSPTVSIGTKDAVYRLSAIIDRPVKDIGEKICEYGLQSSKTIADFALYFRRPYQIKKTFYLGSIERQSLQTRSNPGETDRISLRFYPRVYEKIKTLAYALDCTPSRATALLLESCLNNSNFMNEFFRDYLKYELGDYKRMEELKRAVRNVNQHSTYDEEISWGVFLSLFTDDAHSGKKTLKETIGEFIERWK